MKKINIPRFCMQALIASCALLVAVGAHAKKCKKDDVVCKSKKGVEKGADEVSHAADDATAATDRAAEEAKAAADKTAAEAKAAADKLAAASAAISRAELNSLYSQAASAYRATAGEVKSGYNQSVATLKAAFDASLFALYNNAGKAAISKDRNRYIRVVNKARRLDKEGSEALNRITRAISAKKLDEQVRKDMQLLASKLDLLTGGANIPGNVKKSSFGIQVTSSAADGVGVEQTFGIIMNTFLEDGKFKVGLVQSLGVSYGLQVGSAVSVGIFWGPGSMDDATGMSLGLNYELEFESGGGIGLSWGVPKGILKGAVGPQDAIPGFAASLGAGGEVKVGTLSAGYTKLIAKF